MFFIFVIKVRGLLMVRDLLFIFVLFLRFKVIIMVVDDLLEFFELVLLFCDIEFFLL